MLHSRFRGQPITPGMEQALRKFFAERGFFIGTRTQPNTACEYLCGHAHCPLNRFGINDNCLALWGSLSKDSCLLDLSRHYFVKSVDFPE